MRTYDSTDDILRRVMAYKCLVKISNPISIAVYSKNSDRLAENNSSVGINCLLVPISFLISNSP